MKQGANLFKAGSERVSASISSGTIVDLQDAHMPGSLTGIKNLFKNRIVLNTTEQIFIDFKKNTFNETAREKYHDTLKAYKRKDKIDLMKHLSVPLYDIFKLSLKQNRPLPFQLYDDVKDIQFYMDLDDYLIIFCKKNLFYSESIFSPQTRQQSELDMALDHLMSASSTSSRGEKQIQTKKIGGSAISIDNMYLGIINNKRHSL